MKKQIIFSITALTVFVLSSCTIQIADRPDYYADYDDSAAGYNQASYNNYYSANYNGSAGVTVINVATVMPTPAPANVVVVTYITLRVIENTYYFSEGGKEVAVWKFRQDGTPVKKGKIINGLVKRFYDRSDIVESEIVFVNGERHGVSKKFYPNGLLKEYVNYNKGERNGAYKAYYPNGKLLEETGYKNGSTQGNYKRYFETGELQERGTYEKGKPRVIYAKATPTPKLTPTPVRGKQNDSRGGKYENNKWRGDKVIITAVATETPDGSAVPRGNKTNKNTNANSNNVVINNNVQVVITVVVTATPEIAPTLVRSYIPDAIFTPEKTVGNKDDKKGSGKAQRVVEKKEVLDAVKDEKKQIKQAVKPQNNGKIREKAEDVQDAAGNTADEKKNLKLNAKSIKNQTVSNVTNTAEDAEDSINDNKAKIKRTGPGKK